jgi:hypothetical protein
LVDDLARAELLLRQCKGHQLRREKHEEAAKQAEAGAILVRLAAVTEDSRDHLEAAAVALARAKRLCRDVLRGRS